MRLQPDDVLLVVDVQRDFLPGGLLAVPAGNEIIEPINRLGARFAAAGGHVLLTQDWHPEGHASFAESHPGKQPFQTVELAYGAQVLWPVHCVQGTPGAKFAPGLELPMAELVVRKGFRPGVDSYSAFQEADRRTTTGLAGYLRERGLRRLFLVGLATDFCVAWSALDARTAGFEAQVIEDCCRGIDNQGSLAKAWRDMEAAGVGRVGAEALA